MNYKIFALFKKLLLIHTSLLPFIALSQVYDGDWNVRLEANGRKVDVIFHIKSDTRSSYAAKLDVPIQKAFNVPASETKLTENDLTLVFKNISLRVTLKPNETNGLTGKWEQAGITILFDAKKAGNVTEGFRPKRPQTPTSPFPYEVEEIEFDNQDKTIHFGGTLTLPSKRKDMNFPALVLITGSGKQDRDETIYDHKPFAVIADYLSKRGFAVLRVDDREIGKTTGSFMNSTTQDFKADVEASLEYLKSRKEIDYSRIGLLGHSEGGLIASMIASERADIAFVVLMATPTISPLDLLESQSVSLLVSEGLAESKAAKLKPLMRKMALAIKSAKDTTDAIQQGENIFIEWRDKQTNQTIKSTTGITDEKSMQRYIRQLVNTLNQPWHKYFLDIHMDSIYPKIKAEVLALYAEKDVQVDPNTNAQALSNFLSKQFSEKSTIRILPNLNHLFQTCKKCNLSEYADLEETIAPDVLPIIYQWLSKWTSQPLSAAVDR